MEHRLITGGAQYLPFARSRIKALRAVGLNHASQHFKMPDGDVHVRIVGDQEFITLSGGGDLWALVYITDIAKFVTTPLTGEGLTAWTLQEENQSFIFKFSAALKPELVDYGKSAVSTYAYLVGRYDPDDGTLLGVYFHSATPTITHAISDGAIHGAIVSDGKLLKWRNVQNSVWDNSGAPYYTEQQVTTATTKVFWNGIEYEVDGSISSTASGTGQFMPQRYDLADSAPQTPVFVDNNTACVNLLSLSSTNFYTGTFDAYRVTFGDSPAFEVDPDAISGFELVAVAEPYSRREVNTGHFADNDCAQQSVSRIFKNRLAGDAVEYDRRLAAINTVTDASNDNAIFLAPNRMIRPASTGVMAFEIVDTDGVVKKTFDLGDIDTLIANSEVAAFLADRTDFSYTRVGQYAQSTGQTALWYNWPSLTPTSLAWPGTASAAPSFQSVSPSSGASEYLVSIQFFVDQNSLFTKTGFWT